MNFKAVIFDMDGTTFDTESAYLDIFQSIIEKNGGKVSPSELDQLIGKTSDQVVDFIVGVTNAGRGLVKKDFAITYVELLESKGLALKEGMRNLLNYLKENHIRVAMATSAELALVELNFKHSELTLDEFEFVLTREDVVNPKPDKEVYDKAVKKLGLDANECLVIEDSAVGAMAGVNAGCVVAYVPEKNFPKGEIDDLVQFRFENMNQIVDLLKN